MIANNFCTGTGGVVVKSHTNYPIDGILDVILLFISPISPN
jgi:hypothetical protein